MKKKIHLIVGVIIFVALIFSPVSANARDHVKGIPLDRNLYPQGSISLDEDPTKQTDVEKYQPEAVRDELVFRIITILFGFLGMITVFFIVYNGFRLVTSASQEEVITKAKRGLMWAIIGLLLIILSYSIIRFVLRIPLTATQVAEEQAAAGAGSAGGAAPAALEQNGSRGATPADR